MKKVIQVLTDLQILSALIWAISILACSYVSDKSSISAILVAAAGIHVVLMSQALKGKTNKDLLKQKC